MTKVLATAGIAALLLTGCGKYEESLKILPTEIAQADECKNTNKSFELDCYDLISYKNSIAILRLGLQDYKKGNYKEAFGRYSFAKSRGNFYANSLLADLYNKGRGVPQSQKIALELLQDVDSVDPIAAYKLSFYYMNKKDYSEVEDLLEFAASNNIKDAQLRLSKLYKEGTHIKADDKKAELWMSKYNDGSQDFIKKIYGH